MPATFPPRGFGADAAEKAPDGRWADGSMLSPAWRYNERKLLLGTWQGHLVGDPDNPNNFPGRGDDRHIVTIAGTRAGKSRTVLIPNLLRYPGSVVVIDPKGELVRETALRRTQFGDVHVLDPFGVSGAGSASFNPLWELMESSPHTVPADAALMADALIIPSGKDPHWTDSAKNLLRGMILHLFSRDAHTATLREMRRLLTGGKDELAKLFEQMAANDAYEGIVANTGRGYLGKIGNESDFSGELRSIISTITEQTWPLDDIASISDHTDFFLSSLSEKPTTIYLVLPATRLATHARWLRLLVNLTIAALERSPVKGIREGALPVWLVLEEFAALGSMRSIETAAGFMAGMGCKLWVVLQDLTQLRTHYENSWETFLGNAGIIQAWSNVDVTTTEYLSKLIGKTTILETRFDTVTSQGQRHGDIGERTQLRTVPLLEATEIAFHFARETNRQLILAPGRPPIFIDRFGEDAVKPNGG